MTCFEPFPVLTTARLRLREIVPEDAEAMFRLRSDPEVMRYFGSAPDRSIEETEQRIDRIATGVREGTAIRWGLTLREGGALVGIAGYWRWEKHHRLAEIGYELTPACWGQGLMTEAVRPILRFGFERMELHRVEARLDPQNRASGRVLERLGFRQEGLLRESWLYEGRFTDTAIYGLLDRDLAAREGGGDPAAR